MFCWRPRGQVDVSINGEDPDSNKGGLVSLSNATVPISDSSPARTRATMLSRTIMDDTDLTLLLQKAMNGDREAADTLMPKIYGQLRRMAGGQASRHRKHDSLEPTELIQEAYIRLFGRGGHSVNNRNHFFALAATAFRSVLVDHARYRSRGKRNPTGRKLPLDHFLISYDSRCGDVLQLHDALERLEGFDPRGAQIVELRFFGHLTIPEIASHLNTPQRTIERDWQAARAWLRRELDAT